MNSSLSPKNHLGVRLLAALAAMLVPLLVLGAGTLLYVQLLSSSLGDVVAAQEKKVTLAQIQLLQDQLELVDATQRKITRLTTVLSLVAVAMVTGIGFLLARSILRPLRQLERGVRRFASGDFSYRIAWRREDELGGLTKAFNAMAQELSRERQVLQDLSVRDPLTGLFNHREFYRLLAEELERARRYRHPLSVLILDLDFFKKVNDTYGHQAGDHALRAVTALIVRQLRRVDAIARYGGEEFAVILPETPGTEARALADRIRQAVAARPVSLSKTEEIPLTVSIGFAVYPDDAEMEDDLVKIADKALYRAKREGRNRVCGSRSSGPGEAGQAGEHALRVGSSV